MASITNALEAINLNSIKKKKCNFGIYIFSILGIYLNKILKRKSVGSGYGVSNKFQLFLAGQHCTVGQIIGSKVFK